MKWKLNSGDADTSLDLPNVDKSNRAWEEFSNSLKKYKKILKILLTTLWFACIVGALTTGVVLYGGFGILTAFVWYLALPLLFVTFISFLWFAAENPFLKIINRTLVVLVVLVFAFLFIPFNML